MSFLTFVRVIGCVHTKRCENALTIRRTFGQTTIIAPYDTHIHARQSNNKNRVRVILFGKKCKRPRGKYAEYTSNNEHAVSSALQW